MKTTKFLTLAVVTAALAACASQKPAQNQPTGQAPAGYQQGSNATLNSYPAWKVPADRGTDTTVTVNNGSSTYNPSVTYDRGASDVYVSRSSSSTPAWSDFSRRADFEKSMADRLEGYSREIDDMHGRTATGTDCERRFRYLQVLRDSAKDKVAGLSTQSADTWPTKAYEVTDRMNAIEQYLAADRAACAAGR